DCKPEREAALEPRVREKDLTAAIRPLEDLLVLLVRPVAPEDHEREPERCHQLPLGALLHPAGEEPGEPDVLAVDRTQAFGAVAAEDGPELERPEAPAESRPVLGERIRVLRRAQVLRDERERLPKLLRPRRPEKRAVDRDEQPLVRVDDERVGVLDAVL